VNGDKTTLIKGFFKLWRYSRS